MWTNGAFNSPAVDAARTRSIEAEGYRVLRFWNNDILANAEGVYTLIAAALAERHPHPCRAPAPSGGRCARGIPHHGGGV